MAGSAVVGRSAVGLTAALILLAGCGGSSGSSPSSAGSAGSGSSGSSPSSSAPADNGESRKTGPQVAADAASALESASALHVKGTFSEDGKPGKADLQLQGGDVSGTLSMGSQAFDVIATGGKTYAKANAQFWSSNGVPAAVVPRIAGRWVIVPADGKDDLASSFSQKEIADELRHPTDGAIQPQVTTGQDNGQQVVFVKQENGSTLSVAATGKPYPLHTVNKGSDADELTFSGFDQRQTIAAPAGAIDLTTLGG